MTQGHAGTGYRILCVVGARPNLVKMAPVVTALRRTAPAFEAVLVHTGQHYDVAMNGQFFEALGIPKPDVNLDVGSGSHAAQTAWIMERFEPVLDDYAPDAVLVVGDVNSTLACALVASKKEVPVIHVEAGLRSFDRSMPEEVNRVLTDQISDVLFITEDAARENLIREGIDESKIHFVGNVMIDTLCANLDRVGEPDQVVVSAGREWRIGTAGYGLLTLHRPSNVDDGAVLAPLMEVIAELAAEVPIVFPVHPRTRARVDSHGLSPCLSAPGLICLPPIGYLEMLALMRRARFVMTDSGGVQEETTALGVPCVTLRDNTERPSTIVEGTNTLVGCDPGRIRNAVKDILANGGKAGELPAYWDGQAAQRIVAVLQRWFDSRPATRVA